MTASSVGHNDRANVAVRWVELRHIIRWPITTGHGSYEHTSRLGDTKAACLAAAASDSVASCFRLHEPFRALSHGWMLSEFARRQETGSRLRCTVSPKTNADELGGRPRRVRRSPFPQAGSRGILLPLASTVV